MARPGFELRPVNLASLKFYTLAVLSKAWQSLSFYSANLFDLFSECETHAPKSCVDQMSGMPCVADGFSGRRGGSHAADRECLQGAVCLRKVRPSGRLHRLGQFGGARLPAFPQPFIWRACDTSLIGRRGFLRASNRLIWAYEISVWPITLTDHSPGARANQIATDYYRPRHPCPPRSRPEVPLRELLRATDRPDPEVERAAFG
jgi:hypothetical protein